VTTHQSITFEQPLTERMRLFLRVEYLTKQIEYFRRQDNHNDSGAALVALVELFSLFDRSEIKGEICKELDRHIQRLSRLKGHEDINIDQLHQLIYELQSYLHQLQQQAGKIGLALREDELLSSIRQRLTIPGSMCSFDTPAYHYWLHTPLTVRQEKFNQWLAPFTTASLALNLILNLTRNSTHFLTETAYQGFYQKNLDAAIFCPLVQIKINNQLNVYPEISGGKYRISMRFWQFTTTVELTSAAVTTDIPFEMRCCMV
jgi:cell division protein ZapD